MIEAVSRGLAHEPVGLKLSFRWLLVLLMAFSVSLPMAWISLSKLLLFVGCLVALVAAPKYFHLHVQRLQSMAFIAPTLAVLAFFSISLLWTSAPLDVALASLVKHSRLIVIALLILMLKNEEESRWALLAFSFGLALQLMASWLSAIGMPPPWIAIGKPPGEVFTSYLDQSIIFSTCAAVWWHLAPTKRLHLWAASSIVLASLANVLLLLDGRTGYLIAMALISLAVGWNIPSRFRWKSFTLIPLLVLSLLMATSSNFLARLTLVGTEIQAYSLQNDPSTSTGWRLNAWRLSAQAIEEAPILGHGVGSFTATVKRLQGANAEAVFGPGKLSNPHQEFLLWGIEIGVVGMVLLLAILIRLWSDFNQMPQPVRRAGISVLAALFIACSFNSTLYDGLIGDFFVTLLGLLLAYGSFAKQDSPAGTP